MVPRRFRPLGFGQRKGRLHDAEMRFAANPASAAVDARRSRTAGGAPPRSPTRSFVPYWVVLRRGRVAVPDAGVWRGSRARLKRELNSRGSSILELQNASSVSSRTSQSVTDVQAHPAAVASSFDASFDLASYIASRRDSAGIQHFIFPVFAFVCEQCYNPTCVC